MATWLRRLLQPVPDDLISIEKGFTDVGIRYNCFLKEGRHGRRVVTLPVERGLLPNEQLIRQKHLPILAALEGLWLGGLLEIDHTENFYYIPYAMLDEIPEDVADTLALPKRQPVTVELNSRSAVGMPHFHIEPIVIHGTRGRLPLARRAGEAFIIANDDVILIESPVAELLDRIADHPKTIYEQIQYAADIKAKSKALDVKLDTYLTREDYYYPDDVDIEIEIVDPENINLRPSFADAPLSLNVDAFSSDNWYLEKRGPSGRRLRGILSEDAKTKLRLIEENQSIRGENVPKFLQNPQSVLPDGLDIDLSQYSDRVKALGIQVYKAKPYVRGETKDNGWFGIRAGVTLQDELVGETDNPTQTDLDLRELVELAEAAPKGARWVRHGAKWVELPHSMDQMREANEAFHRVAPQGEVAPNHVQYILEIYSNIQDLEYDACLASLRSDLAKEANQGIIAHTPLRFDGALYPFQVDGYIWMQELNHVPLGGLLADEMGLGKTVQVIAFMSLLLEKGNLRPSLIVAPSTLVDNWHRELHKFLPSAVVYKHLGAGRIKDSDTLEQYDIVLTTYETLSRDELVLGKISWQLMVCDEAQAMKNYTTIRARVCKAMKARMRLAVTGTPVENSLGELWSIVDFSQPGLLGSYREFQEQYESPLRYADSPTEREQIEDQLLSTLQPVYMRRTKAEYLRNLPPKQTFVRPVPFGHEQKQIYDKVLSDYYMQKGEPGVAAQVLASLFNICAHPALEIGNWRDLSADELLEINPKLQHTIDILREIESKKEKALIFTRVRHMQEILVRVIKEQFLCWPLVINGDSQRRLEAVDVFRSKPGFNVMILSPQAAGVGLTITEANHVIHYNRWWNPAVEAQATDRVHRIGQKKEVAVYLPIVTNGDYPQGTVEEILHDLLKAKEELARSVIVPSSELEITRGDLLRALDMMTGTVSELGPIPTGSDDQVEAVAPAEVKSPAYDLELIEGLVQLCHDDFRFVVAECAQRGLPLPDVGVDILVDGKVVGNGELAWVTEKIAIVLPEEVHHATLRQAGWVVFDIGDVISDKGAQLWQVMGKEVPR